jgi:trimethylamine:corrinoid methyltransferase-like protein
MKRSWNTTEAPALDESISEAVSAYVDKRERELAGVNLYY